MGDVDSEGDFAMGVNQVAKSTDVEIMGIASSEFYKLTGRRNVPDVSEVFSRGRFTSRAKEFGMVPGFALDYRNGICLIRGRRTRQSCCDVRRGRSSCSALHHVRRSRSC